MSFLLEVLTNTPLNFKFKKKKTMTQAVDTGTKAACSKSVFILTMSVKHMIEVHGLCNVGFLTLTFAQNITDPKEAQRRLNSLFTNVIKPRYKNYLGVFERQKTGRIHYHLLLTMSEDIRTGFNFDAVSRGDYSSANNYLRNEWTFWRKTSKKYGFGRTELLPIRKDSNSIAIYIAKYLSKHTNARLPCDKGVRLVRYSKGARVGSTRFQFLSQNSALWRKKLALFADYLNERYLPTPSLAMPIDQIDALAPFLGSTWAYKYRNYIITEGYKDFPSYETDKLPLDGAQPLEG